MTRRSILQSLLVAGASLAAIAWTSSPVLGPPWISIEYPPSPYDQTTRGAYLLVHAFHHGTPADYPVTGTAEGIVAGQRRSVTLDFARTSRAGTYALRKQWPSEGVWTLVISVTQGSDDKVTALVDVGPSGDVASVKVPTEPRGGWQIPKRVSMQDVEAALRARAAAGVAGR